MQKPLPLAPPIATQVRKVPYFSCSFYCSVYLETTEALEFQRVHRAPMRSRNQLVFYRDFSVFDVKKNDYILVGYSQGLGVWSRSRSE